MSLTIKNSVPLDQGINKVITDEEKFILETINGNLDIHEKIHEVRKSLKKLRAAVRLVRKATDRYKEENVFYRDLGRRISSLRDKTALIESLAKLRERYNEHLYKRTFGNFEKILLDERETRFKSAFDNGNPLDEIAHRISKHLEEFEGYDIGSFDDIRPGIEKVYKRGKGALREVNDNPSTDGFHEWRKRTKYLRYQLEMLMSAWPHMISAWEESLHELSDLLGDDHDLALLREKAASTRDSGFSDVREWDLINALISFERQHMQSAALDLGAKIYLDSPSDFSARIAGFWKN